MITFKQFINEAVANLPAGLFAKVIPTAETTSMLVSRFQNLKSIEEKSFMDDLHCTVIYSKTAAKNINIPTVDRTDRFSGIGYQLEFFEGHDKLGYIVLKINSISLRKLNKRFVDAGLEATFKDYTPHVTLVHPVPNFDLYKERVDQINKELETDPLLVLTFYYGGYVILDDNDDE
jgi:hypothetical protein